MKTWKLYDYTNNILSEEIVKSDTRPQAPEGAIVDENGSYILDGVGYNYLLQTEKVTPSQLRKGDEVSFYGHIFTITEDAKCHEHTHEDPKYRTWSAKCQINQKFKGWSDDILNSYDSFQGNHLAIELRCIQG